jgi:hypothetical protein
MKPKIIVTNDSSEFSFSIIYNGEKVKLPWTGGRADVGGKIFYLETPYHGHEKEK